MKNIFFFFYKTLIFSSRFLLRFVATRSNDEIYSCYFHLFIGGIAEDTVYLKLITSLVKTTESRGHDKGRQLDSILRLFIIDRNRPSQGLAVYQTVIITIIIIIYVFALASRIHYSTSWVGGRRKNERFISIQQRSDGLCFNIRQSSREYCDLFMATDAKEVGKRGLDDQKSSLATLNYRSPPPNAASTAYGRA